jgi:hypothetical protein
LQGVRVITDALGNQVSKLYSFWHAEGDFQFFAQEMYMLIGKMLFLLFRPTSERLY